MKSEENRFTNTLSFWGKVSAHFSESSSNAKLEYFLRAISLLQSISLILANINFPILAIDAITTRSIRDFIAFLLFIEIFEDFISVWIIVITIYLFTMVAIFLLNCFWSFTNSFKPHYAKSHSYLLKIHSEVLFYPITILLMKIIASTLRDQYNPSFLLRRETSMALGSILLVPNFLLALYKILFCYTPIISKRFDSRKSHFHLFGVAILKICLAIIQTVSDDSMVGEESQKKVQQIVSIIISFILAVTGLINTYIILPEYKHIFLKQQIIYDALATGISVCQLISLFFVEKTFILQITIFIVPFWVVIIIKSFNQRIGKLLYKTEHSRSTDYEIAHLEVLFKSLKRDLVVIPYRHLFSIQTLKANWLKCYQLQELNFISEDSSIQEVKKFKQLYKFFLKQSYEELLESKNNSLFGLIGYCYVILKHFHMYPKAYNLCLKLKRAKLTPPYQLALYAITLEIEESTKILVKKSEEFKSFGYMLVREADEAFEYFKDGLHIYAEKTIEFWKILSSNHPDIHLLYQEAKKCEAQEQKIAANWNINSHKFCKNNPISFLLYGMFKAELLSLPHQGRFFIERFELFFNKKFHDIHLKLDESNTATILISGEKQHLGIVQDCAKSIKDLFGINKTDLIGKNVNVLMPVFFREWHDKFIIEYHETGQSRLINSVCMLFAKDHENNIFPVSLNISIHFDEQKGIIYSGLLNKIVDHNEYILINADNKIQETSIRLGKLLNLEPYSNINISDICSDVNSIENTRENFRLNNFDEVQNRETFSNSSLVTLKPYKVSKYLKSRSSIRFRACIRFIQFKQAKFEFIILKPYDDINLDQNFASVKNGEAKDSNFKKITVVDRENLQNESFSEQLEEIYNFERSHLQKDRLETANHLLEKQRTILFSQVLDAGQEESPPKNTDKPETKGMVKYLRGKQISLSSFSTSASSKSQKRQVIDDLQKVYAKPLPDTFRKTLTIMFGCLLIISLVTSAIEHLVFNKAVNEIDFSVNVIKTSYERLDSMMLCWRFVLVYQTRVNKMYPIVMADLDRYKLVVAYYQEIMKNSNNKLMRLMDIVDEKEKELLFQKNVNLTLEEADGKIQTFNLNNFKAFNLLIEKLSVFGLKPHNELLKNKNPEVNFILKNSVNDLLIISEHIADLFRDLLDQVVEEQKGYLRAITILNIIFTILAALIILFNLFRNNNQNKTLFKALMTIRLEDINRIIFKISSFDKALAEKKEDSILDQLTKVCSFHQKQSRDVVKQKHFSKKFDDTHVFRTNLKQTVFVMILLSCFVGIYFYRSIIKNNSFEELVLTNNRLVVVSKSRYIYNLVIGTGQYLLAFQNTTLMRNQPADQQMRTNLNEIISNTYLTDTFMDPTTNKFIDPFVEVLFKNKLCPYMPEFPGSVMQTNCLKATQNETIGLYAVNMKYYEELDSYSRDFQRNSSYAQAKKLFSDLTVNTVPKFYVCVGTFIVLIDLMSNTFQNQVSFFLDDTLKNFVWQLVVMLFLAGLSLGYLIKKVNSDEVVGALLKMIPYEETIKNKILKNVIITFYHGKVDHLKKI